MLDRSDQPPNPAPDWISELAWDSVVELEQQVPHFLGITTHFEQNAVDWEDWYRERRSRRTPARRRVCLGTGRAGRDELQRMILGGASEWTAWRKPRRCTSPTRWDANTSSRRRWIWRRRTPTRPGGAGDFRPVPGRGPGRRTCSQRRRRRKGVGEPLLLRGARARARPRWRRGSSTEATSRRGTGCSWRTATSRTLDGCPTLQIIEALRGRRRRTRRFRAVALAPTRPRTSRWRSCGAGLKMTHGAAEGAARASLARLYQTCVTERGLRASAVRRAVRHAKLLYALPHFHAVMLERRKFRDAGHQHRVRLQRHGLRGVGRSV